MLAMFSFFRKYPIGWHHILMGWFLCDGNTGVKWQR